MSTHEPGNGGVSFWWQQLGIPAPRERLGGDLAVDVCIVGAGYTGLWTAYYLKKLDPSLRVVVLEARFAGFGASGRNGGWVSSAVTGGRARYAASHGRESAVALQLAHNDTVDEVLRVLDAEGIDADQRKGGELRVARTRSQLGRLRAEVAAESAWPGTDRVELGPRRRERGSASPDSRAPSGIRTAPRSTPPSSRPDSPRPLRASGCASSRAPASTRSCPAAPSPPPPP